MAGVPKCRCEYIAIRVNSTLAVRALHELTKLAPRKAAKLLRDANTHAKRLREDHDNH